MVSEYGVKLHQISFVRTDKVIHTGSNKSIRFKQRQPKTAFVFILLITYMNL